MNENWYKMIVKLSNSNNKFFRWNCAYKTFIGNLILVIDWHEWALSYHYHIWVGNVSARTFRRPRFGAHVTALGTLRRGTLRRWVRYGARQNNFKSIKNMLKMSNKPNLGYNWANKPKPKPEPKPRA
jgi:hypothetical protein